MNNLFFISVVALCRGLAISFLLMFSTSLWAQAASADGEIDLVALKKDIDEVRARLTRLRGEVDRSGFEPEAMVDRLDFEVELIIDFVQTSIVFQPYEGALRGVAGSLQAGAGNSLDQSILLASLLKSAGFDARLVKGRLEDTDALRLLRQTATGMPNASLEYLQANVTSEFPQTEPAAPGKDLHKTKVFQVAQTQEKHLLDVLIASGIPLQPRDVTSQWLPIVREYFWVQHRDGPSGGWQDAHPAFGKLDPPAVLTAEAFYADSVPAKYHHTFSISAWMEQLVSGKIVKHQLMSPWSGPVANLNGVAIRYRNAPNGLNLETASELDKAIANTQFLMPLLNGAQAPGAQAFDLKGRAIDPFALGSPAAGLFKTLGDKLLDATEAVKDDQSGQPVMALHSMWLEFTFATPSGYSQTHRRYLLAPRSDYSGDEQELVWSLMTNHVYMLAAGPQPLDFLADRYLETAIEDMDWMYAMIHKAFRPDTGIPLPGDLPVDFPSLTQYWLMERHPGLKEDVIAYRSVPGLMGLRRGFRDADTAFVGVDIVWNAIEHLRISDTGLEQIPRAALSRGVWETVVEGVPAQVLGLEPRAVTSTTRVFELAGEQGLESKVFEPGHSAQTGPLGLDATARIFFDQDLARGYAVVAPVKVPDRALQAGWWRVHPETGETLGMTGDGYGQESVEYVITDMVLTANSLVNKVNALKECEQQPSMVTKLCCIVEANINNVAGLSFGGILSATAAKGTVRLFNVASWATGINPLPGVDAGCDLIPDTEW